MIPGWPHRGMHCSSITVSLRCPERSHEVISWAHRSLRLVLCAFHGPTQSSHLTSLSNAFLESSGTRYMISELPYILIILKALCPPGFVETGLFPRVTTSPSTSQGCVLLHTEGIYLKARRLGEIFFYSYYCFKTFVPPSSLKWSACLQITQMPGSYQTSASSIHSDVSSTEGFAYKRYVLHILYPSSFHLWMPSTYLRTDSCKASVPCLSHLLQPQISTTRVTP